jgi:hypothetical protein
MHVEVFNLPANRDFTLFVITTPNAPFVLAWYQGDLTTNAVGRGVLDVTGIFSDETFILNPGPVAVQRPDVSCFIQGFRSKSQFF